MILFSLPRSIWSVQTMPQARTKHFSSGQLVTQQSTSSVRIAEQHLSPRTVCRLSSASRLSSIAASFEPTGSRCSPAPDGLAILPETGDFSPFQFDFGCSRSTVKLSHISYWSDNGDSESCWLLFGRNASRAVCTQAHTKSQVVYLLPLSV